MSQAAVALPGRSLVLGRYRPLRPLGSGGSGSVWLAHDEQSGLQVALKIVAREGKAVERAEREALAASRLRHERCLRAYTLAHDAGHVYIAYEYVAGKTVREALRAGELDDAATIEVAAQVAEGLAHAHAHGIVHRDVKPSNVLLAEGHGVSVRLLDFGLAQMEDAATLTAFGDVPGTLAYIAPERLAGETASAAADVWAVGVMLWEALAGGHPFWKSGLLESAEAIRSGAPPLAGMRPDLPKALLAAVDRALALDPARRPSAAALAEALRGARRQRRRRKSQRLRVALPRVRLSPVRPAVSTTAAAGVAAPAAAAGLAALAAGGGAAALPFFPEHWPLALGAAAGALALVRPRLALALALAAPILPLGNVALGLAAVYSLVAVAWLAGFWREPRWAFLPALGSLLGPVGALALLPLLVQPLRSHVRRAAAAAGAVAAAAVSAGVAGAPLPLTGDVPPLGLGIGGSDDPAAVARALVETAGAHGTLLALALVLAAGAAALPHARAYGLWGIAGFGAVVLMALLLAAPAVPALPVVLSVWAACTALAARTAS